MLITQTFFPLSATGGLVEAVWRLVGERKKMFIHQDNHQISFPFNVSGASFIICIVSRCLKITEKVSFNMASEASYVYILSGHKIKNAKNGPFWRVFENLKLTVKQCYQTGQF